MTIHAAEGAQPGRSTPNRTVNLTLARVGGGLGPPMLLLVGVIVAWQFFSTQGERPNVLVPPPGSVIAALVDLAAHGWRGISLLDNVIATVGRGAFGVFLAVIVGVPLGLAMGSFPRVAAVLSVPIQFFRPIPGLAYLVILILWLGSGDSSKIAMLFLVALPTVVTAAAAGVRGVSQRRIDVARSLGASDVGVFRYVTLPSTLPTLSTGIRLASGITFGSVVGAEILVATNGLGWMIFTASEQLRNDVVIGGILILGIIGLALNAMLRRVDTVLIHWRGFE